MAKPSERLRNVRRLYRQRGEQRTTPETVYAIYAVILVVLVVVVPVVYTIAAFLMQPAVLLALQGPDSTPAATTTCGILLSAMVALGTIRGPVLLPPFLSAVVANTDLPRHRTLLRPLLGSIIPLSSTLVFCAVLLGTVLTLGGPATVTHSLFFMLASACFSVLCGTLWLLGQAAGSRNGSVICAAILALTVLTVLTGGLSSAGIFTPWGWMGMLLPSNTPVAGALIALFAAACAGGVCIPLLLDRLQGPELQMHAQRWHTAGMAAFTGDMTHALALFRAQPHIGRRWHAITANKELVRFFIRDFVGALRTPGRFIPGAVFLVASGFVTASALSTPDGVAWMLGAAGATIAYMAMGVFSDGVRHAAEAATAPPLYGYTNARLYFLHAGLPIVLGLGSTAAGAGIVVALGGPLHGWLAAGMVAGVLVTVRIYNSAKGALPSALTTPVPTAFGDLSPLIMLAWEADALLISCVVGGLVVAGVSSLGIAVVAVAVVLTLPVFLVLTRRRLQRMG